MEETRNQFLINTDKHNARTENNAVAHSSTGDELADQFSNAGSYRNRHITQVFSDQSILNAVDPEKALRFVFYLRMVTRKVSIMRTTTEKVQKGQGQRDESFKRFLWYAVNKPEVFYNNIWLFIPIGRYKDIFEILWYADMANINVDEKRVLESMLKYSSTDPNNDLLLKYMPLPSASSKNTTDRAKFMNRIAVMLRDYFWDMSDEDFRKMKVQGDAHTWQQKISQQKFKEINFNNIPGKALHNMVRSDFLSNQGLEDKYLDWIKQQPVAKFTGYPYELKASVKPNMPVYKKYTYDKQFQGLIELAQKDNEGITGNVWCAVDTSSSMGSWYPADDPSEGRFTPLDVCVSLAIYFATLNTGEFHKNIIEFDSKSNVKQLHGSFTDMVSQMPHSAMGSTNFQSVIDEIVRIRSNYPATRLEDYPQTLLVVSDMQFNPADKRVGWGSDVTFTENEKQTNHERAMEKLREVFPSDWVDNFRVIWWDVTGRRPDNHPTHIDEGGTYVFSGWDGAVISLLLGGEDEQEQGVKKKNKSLTEVIDDVLHQEVLDYVEP